MINVRPAILIVKDKHLLTMHYRYGTADVYNLPGGNLEFGEAMADTLVRELQEELLLEVSVGSLVFVGEVHLPEQNLHTLHCIFEGKIEANEPTLNPKETKALDIRWIPLDELPNINLYPNITSAIEAWQHGNIENNYLGKINQQWF